MEAVQQPFAYFQLPKGETCVFVIIYVAISKLSHTFILESLVKLRRAKQEGQSEKKRTNSAVKEGQRNE